jgi:hypothetical protein
VWCLNIFMLRKFTLIFFNWFQNGFIGDWILQIFNKPDFFKPDLFCHPIWNNLML